MNKIQIQGIVTGCLKRYLESQNINLEVNENTELFGGKSVLDSMGLVNVIIDIESSFLDKGIEISLASEKAMSRRDNPFRTVKVISEFISEAIRKKNE